MRYLRVVVPVFVLALAASACGGDDTAAGETNGGGGQLPQEQVALEFNECMRDQGVDMPDNPQGGIAIPGNDPAIQEALEVCRDLLPDDAGPMAGAEMSQEDLAKLQDYVECIREHGIDMPDPEPDGTLTLPEGVLPEGEEGQARAGGGPPEGLDPEYLAATEACQDRLDGAPVRIGGGPGGGQ